MLLKKHILGLLFILIFLTVEHRCAHADIKFRGIGITSGDPSGLSLRLNKDGQIYDAAMAWDSTAPNNFLLLQLDWVKVSKLDSVGSGADLFFYYGLGGRVTLATQTQLGARIPLGVQLIFKGLPFELFFEVAPSLDLIPSTLLKFSSVLGLRVTL